MSSLKNCAAAEVGDEPSSVVTHSKLSQVSEFKPHGLVVAEHRKMDSEDMLEEAREKVYPRQSIVFKLDSVLLVPGIDGYYHQDRDYTVYDRILGEGRTGVCMIGKDHTSKKCFAVKKSKPKIIDLMMKECAVLSHLKPHSHIISFLGAVIDNQDSLLECSKMFMELAENGTLAEMLIVKPTIKEPLPLDQSLYYIEQILQGVHFLHQNRVLHLNINAGNVLVFCNGTTIKLSGFSSAVYLPGARLSDDSKISSFLYFAAPEVVRVEQPSFSSDIWSVMCLLVELLTTYLPGCHVETIAPSQILFLVGQYKDSDVEKMIPFSQYRAIDSELEQLFRQVFVADPAKRPSAFTLLNHRRIKEAREYRKVFEEFDRETISDSRDIQGAPLSSEDSDALQKLLYDSGIKADHLLPEASQHSLESVKQTLIKQGLKELAMNLRAQLNQVIKEQRQYLQRLEDLIASEDTIDVRYLRLFLVGPPFVGKTTTLSRLLGKFDNILTAEENAKPQSTLLANCIQVLAFVNDDTAKWLSFKNADEETIFLFRFLCGAEAKKADEVLIEKSDSQISSTALQQNDQLLTEDATGFFEAKDEPYFDHAESKLKQFAVATKPSFQQSKFLAIKFRLQKLIKTGWDHPMITALLSNSLLNISDIGGQPGFLEMLPALSKGPAMYLAFFDLSKELDQTYKIPFSRDKTVITPFDAIHTVESTISQILSAISSTHYISHELPLFKIDKVVGFKQKFEKFQQNSPRAVLIGTHKDKLLNPGEKIKHIDQSLKRVMHKFSKIMVIPGSKTQERASFFPVNNYSGTEESDIAPLRDFITSVFATHFRHSTLPIRKKWLILSISLRREFCIAKLKDCIELGVILEMDKDETIFCLWYLHNCVGTLMHYTRIPDDEDGWFKNHVICSPQVIFDSISQLILASLRTLHCEGPVTEYEREELIKKGQFSLESIEKYCSSAEVTKKLENKELIPAKQLVALLKHVNLLSPITHIVQGKGHTTYFMPAVLECASEHEMAHPPQPDNNNPYPLHITFECGYVPTGVFCGLITHLVSCGPNGIFGLEWRLDEDGVKRNFVTFCVDHVNKVTLLSHESCYEIRVMREDSDTSLHDICEHALLVVLYNLRNLYKDLLPQIAFRCPCCAASAEQYEYNLCVLKHGSRVRFLCDRLKKPVALSTHQKVWLGKHVAVGDFVKLEVLEEHEENFSFHWVKEGSKHPIQTDESNAITFPAVCEKDFGYYLCKIEVAGKLFLTIYKGLFRECTSGNTALCSMKSTSEADAAAVTVSSEQSVDHTRYVGKLTKVLWDMRAKWDTLGILLGISMGTCEAIDTECRGKVERCFTALLGVWLQDNPKVNDLLEALRSPAVDRADLANVLESKVKTRELVLW